MNVRMAAVAGFLLLACSPPNVRSQGATTATKSLLAIKTIFDNWKTNKTEAEKGMQEFAKAPIALAAMIAKPISLPSTGSTTGSIAQSVEFPNCVVVTEKTPGSVGCERGVATQCTAGDLTLDGVGTRSCATCPFTATSNQDFPVCNYRFNVAARFVSTEIQSTLRATTDPLPGESPPGPNEAGGVTVGPTQLQVATTMDFNLTTTQGASANFKLRVQSCGPITFEAACDNGRSPVTGRVIVRAIGNGTVLGDGIIDGTCARATATACGVWTIDDGCDCGAGAQ